MQSSTDTTLLNSESLDFEAKSNDSDNTPLNQDTIEQTQDGLKDILQLLSEVDPFPELVFGKIFNVNNWVNESASSSPIPASLAMDLVLALIYQFQEHINSPSLLKMLNINLQFVPPLINAILATQNLALNDLEQTANIEHILLNIQKLKHTTPQAPPLAPAASSQALSFFEHSPVAKLRTLLEQFFSSLTICPENDLLAQRLTCILKWLSYEGAMQRENINAVYSLIETILAIDTHHEYEAAAAAAASPAQTHSPNLNRLLQLKSNINLNLVKTHEYEPHMLEFLYDASSVTDLILNARATTNDIPSLTGSSFAPLLSRKDRVATILNKLLYLQEESSDRLLNNRLKLVLKWILQYNSDHKDFFLDKVLMLIHIICIESVRAHPSRVISDFFRLLEGENLVLNERFTTPIIDRLDEKNIEQILLQIQPTSPSASPLLANGLFPNVPTASSEEPPASRPSSHLS